MRRTRRSHSQRGFTLIELMTVIAIIAVITVSLASMSSPPGSGTPATVADQVNGMLSFARLRAEARRTTHRVQFTSTSVTIFENSTLGFTTFTATPKTVQSLEVPSGVVLWAAQATNSVAGGLNPAQGALLPFNLDFKIDGQANPTTIYLKDQNGENKFRIFVYPTTGTAMAREGW